MYNINWFKVVLRELPWQWRKPTDIAWLNVLTSPIRSLYASFLVFKARIDYINFYTSSVIYLEKVLNDRWDGVLKRIFIENVADQDRVYIYNKIELLPKTYYYNKWKGTIPFSTDDVIQHALKVYKAKSNNLNVNPSTNPSVWEFVKDAPILRNKVEYDLVDDFIVWVPTGLVFDENEMKAVVNLYKYAGLNYSIQIY